MKDYQFAGIIPARYASSRFPGKPLALIGNKTMVRRVYEQAAISLDIVYVATDDSRIYDEVLSFGGKVVMTSPDHKSGTDRCAEAVEIISELTGAEIDIVINIQGDEPFISPEQIDLVKSCFSDRSAGIATLARKISPGEDIFDPDNPKVLLDVNNDAIYFSRSPLPCIRGVEKSDWTHKHLFYKHIGLYAYKTSILREITALPESSLEKAESLEQNRWIENGYKIHVSITDSESLSVDTPEDLKRILEHPEYLKVK